MFQSLKYPKMLLSPSAQGLAGLSIVLSFTWKVAYATETHGPACCINEIIIKYLLVMTYLLDSTIAIKDMRPAFGTQTFSQHHKHVPANCFQSPWAISEKRLQKDMVHKEKRGG